MLWQLLDDVVVRITVKTPADEKTWQGFCSAETLFCDPGSPKFQPQPVMVPVGMVERSVKQVDAPKQTGLELKLATGKGFTTVTSGIESTHPKLFVTRRVAVYVPAALYVCVGFCCVELLPSPKFQLHCEIELFPVERSLKTDGLLKQTVVFVKLARGSGFTVTGSETVSTPQAPEETISVTV